MMNSIQFEITIEAQKDTTMWVISADIYQRIMKESAVVANFTNEIMATRFSEVMWLMEQIMWKSFDKRLAEFLLEECPTLYAGLCSVWYAIPEVPTELL